VRLAHKTFFPELSSLNTASTLVVLHEEITRNLSWCDSHPQFVQSLLGVLGIMTPHFATKYNEDWLTFLDYSFPMKAQVTIIVQWGS